MNNDLIFEETKNPTTESEIASLEKRLNITLPNQYRDHILKYNGGYPSLRCFNMPGDRITKIHYFYAIYEGKYSNFENTYTNFKIKQNRMLPHVFPIAYDEGGNQICISIGENDYGYSISGTMKKKMTNQAMKICILSRILLMTFWIIYLNAHL